MTGDRDATTTRQRWLDADIDQAIIDQLFQMYSELSEDSSNFLISTTMTYTANSESVSLPAAVHVVPIYRVEDITNAQFPRELEHVANDVVNSFSHIDTSLTIGGVWSRADTTIIVRPKPFSDLSLRIWYVGNPFSMFTYSVAGDPTASAATTDQHAYPVAHEELICLGAAIRLQEEDEEIPSGRVERYKELWERFQKSARFYKGRRMVKSWRNLA